MASSPLSPIAPVSPWPPPAAPVSHPTQRETYGFIASGGTYILAGAYLLWAFLPEPALEAIGISWYPNREWAILLPSWFMVLILCAYAGYASLMLSNTPGLGSTAWLDEQEDLGDSSEEGQENGGAGDVLEALRR